MSQSTSAYFKRHLRTVQNRLDLGPQAYLLRFERQGMEFLPGQHLSVGCAESLDMREYSICSGTEDDFLEILVRRVDGGKVSPALGKLAAGDQVKVEGPFGFFTPPAPGRPLVMVATGTGVAPFRSLVRSHAAPNFRLIHGVRSPSEAWCRGDFTASSVQLCISGPDVPPHAFPGRLSRWFRENPISREAHYMLCGNCDMIYEVYDILSSAGVPSAQIQAEVYF